MKSGQSVSRYLRDNEATTALETPGNQDGDQGCRNKTVSPQRRTKSEGARVSFVFHLWRETHNFNIRRKTFKISCII
jgi:hypothetical protein